MSAARSLKDTLTKAEIQALASPSDLRGGISVLTTWSIIVASLALVIRWPNVLTVALCLVLLGGRLLALSVLMHEASHNSLFRTRRLNHLVGQWLCAYPTWNDTTRYWRHHRQHHKHTGTDDDPDLSLIESFPTTRRSMARKMARDLIGISGLKRVVGLVLIDFGYLEYNVSGSAKRIDQTGRSFADVARTGLRHMAGFLVVHAVVIVVLTLTDLLFAYALWWAAYLTTFSLFIRLRSIAEHACTERSGNVLRNTRTTHANWLARLTVAPHDVNYHLEHHLLMSVPHYRLPALHRLLKERGLLRDAPLASSYRQVLAEASAVR